MIDLLGFQFRFLWTSNRSCVHLSGWWEYFLRLLRRQSVDPGLVESPFRLDAVLIGSVQRELIVSHWTSRLVGDGEGSYSVGKSFGDPWHLSVSLVVLFVSGQVNTEAGQ